MSETLSGYSDFHFVTEAIPEFWNFSSLCALQRCLKARIWLILLKRGCITLSNVLACLAELIHRIRLKSSSM